MLFGGIFSVKFVEQRVKDIPPVYSYFSDNELAFQHSKHIESGGNWHGVQLCKTAAVYVYFYTFRTESVWNLPAAFPKNGQNRA